MLTITLKTEHQRESRIHSVTFPISLSLNENSRLEQLMEILSEFSKKFNELHRVHQLLKFDSIITVKNTATSEISQFPLIVNQTTGKRPTHTKPKVSIFPVTPSTKTGHIYTND